MLRHIVKQTDQVQRKSHYLIQRTQRQELGGTVKVELLCMTFDERKSITRSVSMKRPQASVVGQSRTLKPQKASSGGNSQPGAYGRAGSQSNCLQGSEEGSIVVSDESTDLEGSGDDLIDLIGDGAGGRTSKNVFWDLTDDPSPKSKGAVSLSEGGEGEARQWGAACVDSEAPGSEDDDDDSGPCLVVGDPLEPETVGGRDFLGPRPVSGRPAQARPLGSVPLETGLDGNDSDDSWGSAASGPSMLCLPWSPGTCENCRKLFTKMRKLKEQRKKIRDKDPASLSCDQWVLKKPWRRRRLRNMKGKLWTHLSRIRKRAMGDSDAEETPRIQASCSRPHVFLQRNMLRCRRIQEALKPSGPAQAKVRPGRGRARRAGEAWPLTAGRVMKKRRKRKPREEGPYDTLDDSSGDDVLLVKQGGPHDDVEKQDVRSDYDDHDKRSGLSGNLDDVHAVASTRRVLRFDDATMSCAAGTGQRREWGGRQPWKMAQDRSADPSEEHCRSSGPRASPCEDSDRFRTPTDLSCVEPEPAVVRKARLSGLASPGARPAVQRGGFRSMLATLEANRSRVIQETGPCSGR